jgi:Au+-exporting ATPase
MSTTTKPSQTLSLAIEGMTCGHCVQAVSKTLSAVPGVTTQSVAIGSAVIVASDGGAAGKALAALDEAGYPAKTTTAEAVKGSNPGAGGGACPCCGT